MTITNISLSDALAATSLDELKVIVNDHADALEVVNDEGLGENTGTFFKKVLPTGTPILLKRSAIPQKIYITSTVATTVNLPDYSEMTIGDEIIIHDYSRNWNTYNCTIGKNGANTRIGGVAADKTGSKKGGFIHLSYAGYNAVDDCYDWDIYINNLT